MALLGGRLLLSSVRKCEPLRTQSRRFSPFAWYNKQLEKSPVITKSITSGVLFGLGDVIAQFIAPEKDGKMNYPRIGRAAIFGSCILGPLAHIHFNFLEFLIVRKLGFQGIKMAFSKMFIDQFTYWAVSVNSLYLFTIPKLEGKSNTEAFENVKRRVVPTMKANYMVWPLAQMVNFTLIPVAHQLNFVLVVSLGWASYLSWAGGQTEKRLAAAAKTEQVAITTNVSPPATAEEETRGSR